MKTPLRVLLVEDREDDADLVLIELRRGGYQPTAIRVETDEGMRAALQQPWDVVISDWSMPRFSAVAAHAVLKEKGTDVPFIIVSGTIGEETAVSAMRAGVHDFMSKGHLSRLVPAIERELREVANRRTSRQIREQLQISERMASIGTLAAGVAHEINNPLGALIGNAEFAVEALARIADEPSPRTRELAAEALGSIRTVQEAAERIRLVVRDLRVFSHPGEEDRRGPVDVRTVLESSLRMASTEIRHRARLITSFEDVPPVEGNEAQLGQVFLNLIVNAVQAMPTGRAESNEIGVATRQDGTGKVVVEVGDNGAGIPPEVLPRIFDPFFTTKPAGEGTGLGLAICHRLITALGGEIAVESAAGKGTTFRIGLPAARRAAAREASPTAAAAATTVPRMRILVVDDEPAMRRMMELMLKSEHDVISVGSGKDALARVAAGERFGLVLCDLMMPQMTGMDLHAAVGGIDPAQAERMAFVTGGAFSEEAQAFLARVQDRSIDKPFNAAQIREFVRSLLR